MQLFPGFLNLALRLKIDFNGPSRGKVSSKTHSHDSKEWSEKTREICLRMKRPTVPHDGAVQLGYVYRVNRPWDGGVHHRSPPTLHWVIWVMVNGQALPGKGRWGLTQREWTKTVCRLGVVRRIYPSLDSTIRCSGIWVKHQNLEFGASSLCVGHILFIIMLSLCGYFFQYMCFELSDFAIALTMEL